MTPYTMAMNIFISLALLFSCISSSFAASGPEADRWDAIQHSLAQDKEGAANEAIAFIKKYPTWPDSYASLAMYYTQKGKRDNSAKLLKKAVTLPGANKSAAVASAQAMELFLDGELTKAEALFKSATQRSAKNAEAYFNLGVTQRALAHKDSTHTERYLDEALVNLQQAVSIRAGDYDYRLATAYVLLEQGKFQEAERSFSAAASLDSKRNEARIGRASALIAIAADNSDNTALSQAADDLHAAGSGNAVENNDVVQANSLLAEISAGKMPSKISASALNQLPPLSEALVRWRIGEASSDIAQLQTAQTAIETYAHVDDSDIQRMRGHINASVYKALKGKENLEADEAYEKAKEAYWKAAGNDQLARTHYLALTSQTGPKEAYAAGLMLINRGALDIQGWKLVIGNYGPSGSWSQPIHLAIWGILILASLAMAFFLRAQKGPTPIEGNADQTFLPRTSAHKTSPLQKGRSRNKAPTGPKTKPVPQKQPSQAADETLMPQSIDPDATHAPLASDKKRRR